MLVKSKEGSKCPKEGKPREYITDDAAEEVPDTAYYHRLVNDGSLVVQIVVQKPAVQSPEPGAGQETEADAPALRAPHSKRGGNRS